MTQPTDPPQAKPAAEPFWEQVTTERLAQGDYLPECFVPVISGDIAEKVGTGEPQHVRVDVLDLIVMTQSCDLENNKAPLVACCPIHPILRFQEFSARFKQRGEWEKVRQGRQEGLHLLGSTTAPGNNQEAFVVDFRGIYSLPVEYLRNRATAIGPRYRLRSPFLEHFSQAFARFFMRVGLPSPIPPYK
jgi:hypothetical protein